MEIVVWLIVVVKLLCNMVCDSGFKGFWLLENFCVIREIWILWVWVKDCYYWCFKGVGVSVKVVKLVSIL